MSLCDKFKEIKFRDKYDKILNKIDGLFLTKDDSSHLEYLNNRLSEIDNIWHVFYNGNGSVRLFDKVFGSEFSSDFDTAVLDYSKKYSVRVARTNPDGTASICPKTSEMIQKEIRNARTNWEGFVEKINKLASRRSYFIFSILGIILLILI